MEGQYQPFRATCQGCQSIHLDLDAHGQRRPAETIFVHDRAPDGYEPDPRMMPRFDLD